MLLLFEVLQKLSNYGTSLNQVSILLTKNLPVTILVTFIVGGFPQIFFNLFTFDISLTALELQEVGACYEYC